LGLTGAVATTIVITTTTIVSVLFFVYLSYAINSKNPAGFSALEVYPGLVIISLSFRAAMAAVGVIILYFGLNVKLYKGDKDVSYLLMATGIAIIVGYIAWLSHSIIQ
jgi:hypothetical protein